MLDCKGSSRCYEALLVVLRTVSRRRTPVQCEVRLRSDACAEFPTNTSQLRTSLVLDRQFFNVVIRKSC